MHQRQFSSMNQTPQTQTISKKKRVWVQEQVKICRPLGVDDLFLLLNFSKLLRNKPTSGMEVFDWSGFWLEEEHQQEKESLLTNKIVGLV